MSLLCLKSKDIEIDHLNKKINTKESSELIDSLVKGDEDAFRKIINLYRDAVLRICIGFTGSQADADDLAQEVFIEIFRSIRKFRGRSKLSTWIYRIAVNKSLNYIRDNRRMHSIADYEDEYIGKHLNNESTPDERMISGDHARALHLALDKLPDAQRTAFILSKYEDMKYQEIAHVMNSSVSRIESLIFRAKRSLQEHLYNYYKESKD